MSNLSLARIMYGTSEFPASSGSMQPRPLRMQSSNLSYGLGVWMNKLFSALFSGRSR
jgi:hypothetical protein